MRKKRVGVFCGARPGKRPLFRQAAHALGEVLGQTGCDLVWGGAQVGLMGAVADGVISKGGRAIGVLPHGLARAEFAHRQASELIYVHTMAERKAQLAELSDAFIALPGGFGTLDELFEMLTLAQVGLSPKNVGLLNVDGYWGLLCQQIQRAVDEEFIAPAAAQALICEEDPKALLRKLLDQAPLPSAMTWLPPSPAL